MKGAGAKESQPQEKLVDECAILSSEDWLIIKKISQRIHEKQTTWNSQ